MRNVKKTFVKSIETVNTIRADYIIALIPAIIWSIFRFGFHAFEILAIAIASCVVSDLLIRFLLERKMSAPSLYSLYCGAFLGLSLYPSTSVLIAGLSGVICAFVLSILGGSGKCFVFAPIAARIIAFELIPNRINKPENMSFETLLNGELPTESAFDFMLGSTMGALGSVSLIAIAIGAVYLLIRKSADFRVSVSYILVAALLYFIFPLIQDNGAETAMYEIMSGEIIFAAVFALTDFAALPESSQGKYAKGALCAILTYILRRCGFTADAVFLAILISDVISALFSKIAIYFLTVKEAKYAK